MSEWIWNPKLKDSGMIACIPQSGRCLNDCADCFFQSGRSYLEPLDENLPHVPSKDLAKGRVVRMNDGNDSNVERGLVIETALQYDDFFFNTCIPESLAKFPGPVVLTVNPGKMTDVDFHRIDPVPKNLMFVRVRTNAWNVERVVDHVVAYYAVERSVPVVLTFMAYYETPIPETSAMHYVWRKRTLNEYHAIKSASWRMIMQQFLYYLNVHSCGREGVDTHCRNCGNCLREYHATRKRMRECA